MQTVALIAISLLISVSAPAQIPRATPGTAGDGTRPVAFARSRGAAGDAEAKLSPDLARLAPASGPVEVIVLLWDQEVTNVALDAASFATERAAFAAEAERSIDAVVGALGRSDLVVTRRYQSFAGFAARASIETLRRLAEDPLVRVVVPNLKAVPDRIQGNTITGVPAARVRGARGAGVSVAVIDDGVDYMHPELGGGRIPNSVVVAGWNFVNNTSDPAPGRDTTTNVLESHGTSVAAIIAGRGESHALSNGVAPDAKIVALRADASDQVLQALDWIVANGNRIQPNIRVVNMSISFPDGGFFTSNCDAAQIALTFASAVNRLTALNIAVVVSSGNQNKIDRTAIPACLSQAISVGATYDANIGRASFKECTDQSTAADIVTCYSNSASFVSLLAPSHLCRTAQAGGGYDPVFGGTSAAAPYTAGAFAVLMGAAPGRTPSQYRDVLRSTGRLIRDPKSGISTPRIDVDRALEALTQSSNPTFAYRYFIPAVARSVGQNGTFFQSEMRIFNRGTAPATVRMFLLQTTNNATAHSAEVTVQPGRSAAFADIVKTLIRLDAGIGSLLIDSTQPLHVTSSTFTTNNICPDRGGTLGQFIPASETSQASTRQRLYHVVHNSAFRTNLGLASVTRDPASVTIVVRDANGSVLGQTTASLGIFGWQQIGSIVDAVRGGTTDDAYIDVTSDRPLLTYVSIVDNKTGDPIYVGGTNQ